MKNKRGLLLLLLLCLMPWLAFAQHSYSSRVVDAKTGEGIPYATVRASATEGTQSDLEGRFSIECPPATALVISCMGYEKLTIKASALGKTVELSEAASQLHEVEVHRTEPLLVQISHRASEAYRQHKDERADYFMRFTQISGSYRHMAEAFFEAQSSLNLRDINFLAGRQGQLSDDGKLADGRLMDVNLQYLLEIAPMIHDAKWDDVTVPLKDGATEGFYRRNYNITYDLIAGEDGNGIYVITLAAKPANTDFIYTGTLYVDATTLDPLRMDGYLEHFPLAVGQRNKWRREAPETVRIHVVADYTTRRGFPEVSVLQGEFRSRLGYSRITACRVEGLDIPNRRDVRRYPNLLDAIDRAGFDETIWEKNQVLRRTAEEAMLAQQFSAPKSVSEEMLTQTTDTMTLPERPRLPLGAVTATPSTLQDYAARLQQFGRAIPQEKVYVHMDNTCYFAGDTLFFAAYTRRTDSGRPSTISRVFYAELWTPDGYLLERQLIQMNKGRGSGSFVLPDTLYGGYYELRAYTRWQLNWGITEFPHTAAAEDWFYTPELARDYYRDYDKLYSRVFPVYDKPKEAGDYQRDMTSRPLRRYYNDKEKQPDLRLSFFPEGGSLVEGVPCRVAFEAATEAGEWLVGRLAIVDEGDTVVATNTLHRGRGVLEWVPQSGHAYRGIFTVTGTAQQGRSVEAPLPQVEADGVALRLQRAAEGWTAAIDAHGTAASEPLGATVMHEGILEFFSPVTAGAALVIPADSLRMGVNQLTVFDAHGCVWADRLFFVQPDTLQRPTVTVEGLEESYEPYAQVEIALQSSGQKASLLSVAVRDAATQDALYDNASIFSEMLLASELKGFIPHPDYYFEAADEQHRTALDLLMMTQGWRRFEWHEMAVPRAFRLTHPAEYTQIITGQVMPLYERRRQDDMDHLTFIDYHVDPPEQHTFVPSFVERHVSEAEGPEEERTVGMWLYGQDPLPEERLGDVVSLLKFLREYAKDAYENNDFNEEYTVLYEQMRGRGSKYPSGNYRLTKNIGNHHFLRQPGALKHEMRVHAEYAAPGYEPLFGEITTRGGQFRMSTPEIHGSCYFFLAAADTTRWKRSHRHEWVYNDETSYPEAYVRIHWPYPRFVKPFSHYQQQLAPARHLAADSTAGQGSGLTTDLAQITVRARHGGLRRFDASHPVLKLDAYEAFNEVADAGLMTGCFTGRTSFTNALARLYMGDMRCNNPYLMEPRFNGHTFAFNMSPARRNDYNYLYNLDSVYIYSDYAPRLPDERFTEENMPRVTIDLRKAAGNTQRYTYRDRRYILQGFSIAEDFYSPNYRLSPPTPGTRDYRRTLYWNPALQLDATGRARIQLFTGSRPASIIVEAEGMAADGTLLYNTSAPSYQKTIVQ